MSLSWPECSDPAGVYSCLQHENSKRTGVPQSPVCSTNARALLLNTPVLSPEDLQNVRFYKLLQIPRCGGAG